MCQLGACGAVVGSGMMVGRLTQTNQNTVQRVLEAAGSECAFLMDQRIRNVSFAFTQVDELFCFAGCKEKSNHAQDADRGRRSVFLRVDVDSKFIINWTVGMRNSVTIEKHMQDLKQRIKTPF